MLKVPEYEVLKLFSLQKNQVTIFILKMVLEGVPSKGVKLSRNTVSFFPLLNTQAYYWQQKKKKKNALYSLLLQSIKFWPLATGYHNNW